MKNKEIKLSVDIVHDEYTKITERMFDVPLTEKNEIIIKNNIEVPEEWNIGLIYGPSGSGKSTLLKTFGDIDKHDWNGKAVISNFTCVSPEDASNILCSIGMNTIPSWLTPYEHLSNGEKFRADLAMSMAKVKELILIDEFTSVIDRNVAKSASNGLQKYVRNTNKKVILSSCHSDIIDWLQPDWIYNPTEGITHILPRGSLQRPKISLKIFRTQYEAWDLFKRYHYLDSKLNRAAKCFLATWEDVPVAFSAVLSFPHAVVKNGWRASRTVVLPDYQGLGIGVRLSNHMGSMIKAGGGRFFSKTIHPAMVAYRLKNKNLWKETAHSRESRKIDEKGMLSKGWDVSNRYCYAFEYIGNSSTVEDSKLFWEKL